jgi:hypothetical protein
MDFSALSWPYPVMCPAGGTPAGSDPKLAHARLWLWETCRQNPPIPIRAARQLARPEALTAGGRSENFALSSR